jgi:DNA polymerase
MSWASSIRKAPPKPVYDFLRPTFPTEQVDWSRLVSIDFETYYDDDYTLSKLSTSEYIRDERFEALMMGVKVGRKKRVVIPGPKIAAFLKTIPWSTHTLLCHNNQFDGFILGHHYKVVPAKYYCTLSMARGLHSNEIGAGLDEVAQFYGRGGKLKGNLEKMKGRRYKQLVTEKLYDQGAEYCGVDVDEMLGIFQEMLPNMPKDEIDLIDLTVCMFCDPVLKVDLPRVKAELDREVYRREELLLEVIPADLYEKPSELVDLKALLKSVAERELTGKARHMLKAKRIVGSNEKFADLLRAESIEPPVKLSPAWMKKPKELREDKDKWAYAFAKDDEKFINLPDDVDALSAGLNLGKVTDIKKLALRQERLRNLVDCRIAVKSTTNITRAERFLKAGAGGMPLPCGYAYYRAHTGRWGGNNKMNMQNLTRGGELRLSILAAKEHNICTVDSGQIEARVNAWLWDQLDLLDAFRTADTWDKSKGVARGDDRDAYCRFADLVYRREITTDDKTERFVGKVCVLGLGYQMGAAKLQITLAKGALGGPPVFFTLDECKAIINTYRRKNNKIRDGWEKCKEIIEDMAVGRTGSWKCISWEKGIIWLPNGMSLKYPDLKQRINDDTGYDEWTYQSGEQRKKIYGGLLCENLVQALARIIVGKQMLDISRKYRVVMTTHDEVSTHVKEKLAPKAFAFMQKVMKTPLQWCADIPLNCEGGYDINYSK